MLLVGVAATSCSDTPLAPPPSGDHHPLADRYDVVNVPLSPAATPTISHDGVRFDLGVSGAVQYTFTFTIDPRTNTVFSVGANSIRFPAYSVCNPTTSGYGSQLWDTPCSPAQMPITVVGTVGVYNDHAVVSFNPALRFVPSSDPARWVMLRLTDATSLRSRVRYSIDWLSPTAHSWVDESVVDPTMVAHLDAATNTVTRRLKHFSGYNISTGEACDPTLGDPNCIDNGT